MRFLVDRLPYKEKNCPFAKWIPYPPMIKDDGYFKCNCDDRKCNLATDACRWLYKHEVAK